MNLFLGILIGTAMLWILGLLVVNPLAIYFTKRQLNQILNAGAIPQDQNVITAQTSSIFTRNYILIDVIILSIAGFLMGYLAGWFFIGISWRARDWPGLIAFIGLSILGSYLHW